MRDRWRVPPPLFNLAGSLTSQLVRVKSHPLDPLVCSFLTYGQIGKVTFLGKLYLYRKIFNFVVGYGIYDVPQNTGEEFAPFA